MTGRIKHGNLFARGSGVWTSQVKVLADLLPGEGSLPSFSMSPHMHPTVSSEGTMHPTVSSEGANPIMRAIPL